MNLSRILRELTPERAAELIHHVLTRPAAPIVLYTTEADRPHAEAVADVLRTKMGRSTEVHLPLVTAGRKMDRAEWIVVDDLQWPETVEPESLRGVGVSTFMREYMHDPSPAKPRATFRSVELPAEPVRKLAATIEQLPPETRARVRQRVAELSAEYARRIERQAIEDLSGPPRYDPAAQTSGTRPWHDEGTPTKPARPYLLTEEAQAFLRHPPA